MPSETWTASKVAQIAQLKAELEALKSRCQALVDESYALRNSMMDRDYEKSELLKEINDLRAQNLFLTQDVKEASEHLRKVWECAQDGVCKKCGVKGYGQD